MLRLKPSARQRIHFQYFLIHRETLNTKIQISMKVILRHKDLHAYGKICESVHKTASANKICKRKRNFAKV